MNSDGSKTLIKRLRRSRKVREQFVESHISKGIAFQVRATRDRLGWKQDRLASEVGMTQNAISRLESPEYGKPTITTLKRLAAALDVGLVVHFVPFSQMIDWVSGTRRVDPGLATESLAVPTFQAEEDNGVFDSAPERIWTVQATGGVEWFEVGHAKTGGIRPLVQTETAPATGTVWTQPIKFPPSRAFDLTKTEQPINVGEYHG